MSQFPALAAGSVLYLSSPEQVCNATREGRWGDETDHFLHEVAHGHEHRLKERAHSHDDVDAHSIEFVFHQVNHHYKPIHSEVSPRLRHTAVLSLENGEYTYTY